MLKQAVSHAALSMFLATPLALAFVGQGCGQAVEVCDVVCECEHCSDRAEDLCLIEVDRILERAEAYGCDSEAEELLDCVVDDNDCDDANFTFNDCLIDEGVELQECMNDESDIMGSTGAIGEGEGETAPPPPGGG